MSDQISGRPSEGDGWYRTRRSTQYTQCTQYMEYMEYMAHAVSLSLSLPTPSPSTAQPYCSVPMSPAFSFALAPAQPERIVHRTSYFVQHRTPMGWAGIPGHKSDIGAILRAGVLTHMACPASSFTLQGPLFPMMDARFAIPPSVYTWSS